MFCAKASTHVQYSVPKILGRGVRLASRNFMTKICDFPYPIYDLTKNLKNIICEGLLCWSYLACAAGVKRGREGAKVEESESAKVGESSKVDTLFITTMVAKWL